MIMRTKCKVKRSRIRVLETPIPRTRDPFINNFPVPLTPDPATGAARYWMSTVNFHSGCFGVCFDEFGNHRIYRFKTADLPLAYSVVQQNEDTLWLVHDLASIKRLSLRTGKIEKYETGAKSGLVFAGMPYDPVTGKVFAVAVTPPVTSWFVFNIHQRKAIQTGELPDGAGKYMRWSFPNGDGTYSVSTHVPGNHLLRWNPRTGELQDLVLAADTSSEDTSATTYFLLRDERGRIYVPKKGWFDPRKWQWVKDGPRPETEMTWFARWGTRAVGITYQGSTAHVGIWDMSSGSVAHCCDIADTPLQNVAATPSGSVVGISLYGEFFRYNGITGALEASRWLETDAVGHIDCICRVDERRILGTTFITQRFWEADLKTGTGQDLGRAAPGNGEIMKLVKVGKKIYLAAYTGGELMEYDPSQAARFPENPRVIADPPGGMRPVSICTDGRQVWYSCSREYGNLGCALSRYDTKSGTAVYAKNPLGDLMIHSLVYDKRTRTLLAGTTIHADCQSAKPTACDNCIARLDAMTLAVIERVEVLGNGWMLSWIGPLSQDVWLAYCRGEHGGFFAVPTNPLRNPRLTDRLPVPDDTRSVIFAGRKGHFVLGRDSGVEYWDLLKNHKLEVLQKPGRPIRKIEVQGNDVLILHPDRIRILEKVVSGC